MKGIKVKYASVWQVEPRLSQCTSRNYIKNRHFRAICNKVIEKYQSWEGYKSISKSLSVPEDSWVNHKEEKWKKCGTAANVSIAICPQN